MFLTIEAKSVASAWIQALQRVFFEGDVIKTQYDTDDDLPSLDCTAAIHVTEPLSEPMMVGKKTYMINGLPVYCHPSDLYCIESIKSGYLSEVLGGNVDHCIWEETKSYPYTYHDRLYNYLPVNTEDLKYIITDNKERFLYRKDPAKAIGYMIQFEDGKYLEMFGGNPVNQIDEVIKQLKRAPYTRRAQAITWRPISDNRRDDPPCLQRLFFRILDGKLRVNAHWRSRDLFGAWEANVNGMLMIGQHVAKELGVQLGEYFDFSDSLHVYRRKKKLYKEIVPLLERVSLREGLLKPEYKEKLAPLIDDAKKYADKDE